MERTHACNSFIFLARTVVTFFSVGVGDQKAFSQASSAVSKEVLVKRLKYSEGLLVSAEAEFEVTRSATRREMVPLIKEFFRLPGKPDEGNRYIFSENEAKERSYKAHWWRNGERERLLKVSNDGDKESLFVFDGQFVKALKPQGEKTVGTFDTLESAHWNNTNRITPFNLIHYYKYYLYSDFIESAKDCLITDEVLMNGSSGSRVTFTDPRDPTIRFSILYDTYFRMVERRLIAKLPADKDFRIYEIHSFESYETVNNPRGDPIDMPMKVVQKHVCGQLPNGAYLEPFIETVKISKLAINPEIPEEMFELSYPADVEVYDGVMGHGWLHPGEQPDYLLPTASERKHGWLVWLGVGFAVLLLAFGFYIRAIRRRGKKDVP